MRIIITLFALTALLSADTLYLKNGDSVRGTFISGDGREIQFRPNNTNDTNRYSIADVSSVSFGPGERRNATLRETGTRARTADRAIIPTGTTVTVRMIDSIDSDATNVGESFRASLDEPIVVDGRTIIPKGVYVTVKVVKVDEAMRISGTEQIAVELSEIVVGERRYAAESTHAVVAAKARGEENLQVIGGTAVVGAMIGAIAGGGKGAAIGAAAGAGAGAAIQSIRGQRVQIPTESRLDFNLSQPIYID